MAVIGRPRHRLRLLVRSEHGMALPTALLAMTIAFSMAGAAILFSIDTQHGTARDHDSKEAIAAADAGVSVAQMRLNQVGNALGGSSCVRLSGNTLTIGEPEADGWCPELTGTVGNATYAYRVGPTAAVCVATGGIKCVVAVGTANGVSRRVAVSLDTSTTHTALEKAGVLAEKDIKIENHAEVRVGVGTNGNITMENNAVICGNARHGVGKAGPQSEELSCEGEAEEGNEPLPAVSSFMPEDIATNNSDYRLVKCTVLTEEVREPEGCQLDSYTRKWTSTVPWDPGTRTISTQENATLTLTGGDYFVCRLVLSNNSHLIIGAKATVRIFFDTPENCGLTAGAEQISVSNNADITDSGYQPSEENYAMPGLYLMGSTTIPTTVSFSNNTGTTSEFVLYAPNTDIVIDNNATYKGAIAGKTVILSNHAKVEQDAGFQPPQIGGATLFSRQSYVECTGGSASPPDANC